jgi:phosphate transport system permease protein
LLILPIIIVATRESLRAVPDSIRMAGFAMGADRWQVAWSHVLPAAISGILTGVILALSRAIGETAPADYYWRIDLCPLYPRLYGRLSVFQPGRFGTVPGGCLPESVYGHADSDLQLDQPSSKGISR